MHPTSLAIRGGLGMAENKKITLEPEKVEEWTYFQKGGASGFLWIHIITVVLL